MKIKVVTFNLRMNYRGDGINYFFNRSPYILNKIRQEMPDIIGFQEAKEPIYEWLKANLPEYTFVGVGRESDFSDEANPVAFRKDRFELFSYSQFWLSETPEIPGSRYAEQSICPRICVCTKLKLKNSTKVLRFYNTHLDHVGVKARLLGIGQILDTIRIDKESASYPVILTGDMNANPDEASMLSVSTHPFPTLIDAAGKLKRTFHGFDGGSPYADGDKIDYIYTDLVSAPIDCDVWDECHDGIYLSDHYPVAAVLEWE